MKETRAPLYEALLRYADSGAAPFHMPGHKRNAPFEMQNPYLFDLTEIDGFDDLHAAEGLLKTAMERAASLFHSRRTFFQVNGSSGGTLAAVFAMTRRGDHILMARNSHKSVYHAAALRGLRVDYLYGGTQVCGTVQRIAAAAIDAAEVEEALRRFGDIRLVILTSPSYEGILSDVKQIAEACHAHGALLFVDEAHGAHLAFMKGAGETAPQSAVLLGADVVVQSLHKTLPALTQTALLHCVTAAADEARLARYCAVFQTTSPSYVLMAAIDLCMAFLEEAGTAFADYDARLSSFYARAERQSGSWQSSLPATTDNSLYVHAERLSGSRQSSLPAATDNSLYVYAERQSSVRLLSPALLPKGCLFDRTKLILLPERMSGPELYQRLRVQFSIQPELAAPDYVLCLSSVCDAQESFDRLLAALETIEQESQSSSPAGQSEPKTSETQRQEPQSSSPAGQSEPKTSETQRQEPQSSSLTHQSEPQTSEVQRQTLWKAVQEAALLRPMRALAAFEAEDEAREWQPFSACAGRVAAQYCYLYPPGVPLLAPGEVIDAELVYFLQTAEENGLKLNVKGGLLVLQAGI